MGEMSFSAAERGERHDVRLCGALVFNVFPIFEQMADGVRRSSCTEIRIDLSGLVFIDSAGLGMLFALADEVQTQRRQFALRNPAQQVHDILELTSMSEVITIVQE